MNERKETYIILACGIAMACVAILSAWLKFDYRAALLVADGILIGISMGICLHFLDDLHEAEDCELHVFKCRECGEVVKYRIFADSPDECQEASKLVNRCPLCGGELTENPEDFESEESDHAQ